MGFGKHTTQKNFFQLQRQKIDELHNYLEDRYLHIVCQYNTVFDRDVALAKNKIEIVSEDIDDNKHLIKKVQKLRNEIIESSNEQWPRFQNGLLKNLVKVGKFIDYYNDIRQQHQDRTRDTSKPVFSQHVQAAQKYLSVDV